jgi:uncharacterized protein YdaT
MSTTKSTSNRRNRTHIIKRGSGWAVKQEGKQRASRVYKTKEEAIKSAQEHRKHGSDIVVHRKDGSVEKWKKSSSNQ